MDAKSKLMAYLKGWAHGAGRKAIQFQDQPDYMRGYREGYDAYCKVATEAQEHYGAKLSVLRTQDLQAIKQQVGKWNGPVGAYHGLDETSEE